MGVALAGVIAVLRWLMLAGLSGALGGLGGRGLARQYKGTAPAPLPPPWALRSSLLGALATAALTGAVFGGRALATLGPHSAAAALVTTGQGEITAAECAGFLLAAAALRFRKPGLAVFPLLVVVLAEGLRAHPEGLIPVAGALLSYAHLLPAVLWAGMLFYTVRAALAWRHDPVAMRGLVRLYGTAAAWLFTLIVATGVVTALVLVPLGSLLTTGYGIIVILKAVLVAVVAGLAIAGRAWLGRAAAAGSGPARATRWECYAVAAVLAVTALLTVVPPPSAGPSRAAPARTAGRPRAAAVVVRGAGAQPAGRPPRVHGS